MFGEILLDLNEQLLPDVRCQFAEAFDFATNLEKKSSETQTLIVFKLHIDFIIFCEVWLNVQTKGRRSFHILFKELIRYSAFNAINTLL